MLPHTCHCVLPINLYNDKIFASFTFLFAVLGVASCINLILWFMTIYGYAARYILVKNLVKDANHLAVKR